MLETEEEEGPVGSGDVLDELPGYDEVQLPTYQRSSVSHPTAWLRFRQTKAKLVKLESIDSQHSLSYKIVTKSTSKLFSSKPEMSLLLETEAKDMFVAGIAFDNSSTLPWFPRATVTVDNPGQGTKVLPMMARNFADWKIEHEGKWYGWTLQGMPTSLAFVEAATGLVLARFTYSIYGTTARDGQEIGDLAIFALTQTDIGTEVIIGSCIIVIKYWAKMGRHHRQGASIMGRYSYGSGVTLASASKSDLCV